MSDVHATKGHSHEEANGVGPEREEDATVRDAHQNASHKRRRLGHMQHSEALHAPGGDIHHAGDADASLVELETRELLAEATIPDTDVAIVQDFIGHLRDTLERLPAENIDPTPISAFLQELDFPSSRQCVFRPPERVDVIGSFAIRSAVLPRPCLDLAILMPRSCFDDKDYLNHRYHGKRGLYLSHVFSKLSTQKKGLEGLKSVDWELFRGDPRRPVLVLTLYPCGVTVRLIPALSFSAFPLAKLAPDRNCLRSVRRSTISASSTEGGDAELLPTPYYNRSIVEDMLLLEHARSLQVISGQAPAFAEAAVLLRVWLVHHKLDQGADGVSGFLLTMLLAQLLESGQVSLGMGPLHLFRSTLLALANRKTFAGTGVLMTGSSSAPATKTSAPPSRKSWKAAGSEVVFVDSSGWLNISANLSAAAMQHAQDAAGRSAELLSSSGGSPEAFDAVFHAWNPFGSLYDVWYKIAIPESHPSDGVRSLALSDEPYWTSQDRQVQSVTARALGTRATLVRVFHRQGMANVVNVAKRSKKGGVSGLSCRGVGQPCILLGLRLDPTIALRAVDVGPAADSGPPAAEYRAFWGEKSELRRFQDGKISEAVVWEAAPSSRHAIVDDIVAYIVRRHVHLEAQVSGSSRVIDAVLLRGEGPENSEKDFMAVQQCEAAATRLGKRLRALNDLTLRVVSTQPAAPVLRHAAVFPPLPHPLAAGGPTSKIADLEHQGSSIPRCLPAVDIFCQLEGSGKWPDDPIARGKMTSALGVQLAQTLHSSYGMLASAAEGYVDVLTDGYAFRLRLYSEMSDVELLAWHHGIVSATAAENPAFEPAVRLAKRWVASQWLSPHLREEAVELLMVAAFGRAYPSAVVPPPASRVCGFLRFLRLLGDHPWAASPLILKTEDSGGASSAALHAQRATQLHAAQRAAGVAPAMYIAGFHGNDECVQWTIDRPSTAMVHRAAVLARRAAESLERFVVSTAYPRGDNGVSQIFEHDEHEYELLIRLRTDALPHLDQSLVSVQQSKGHKGMKSGSSLVAMVNVSPEVPYDVAKRSRSVLKGIPWSVLQTRGVAAVRRELLVGFDPLPLFVSRLENRFRDVAVVCTDYLGGRTMGLKLRGHLLQAGALRPECSHAVRPLNEPATELLVSADLAAIAADVLEIGAGIVDAVEYNEASVGGRA